MLAIFKTGGKQYSAKAGAVLKVEKLDGTKGDTISFTDVLAISDAKANSIGEPILKNASVEAKIIDQIRDKKIIVFKKRKRQNYRLTQGHRQYLTVLRIESISYDGKKTTASPEVEKTKKIETKDHSKIVEKKETKVIKKKVVTKKKVVSKKTINKASSVKKKSVKKAVKKTKKSKEDK
tara:strand:- start:27 stop:563 length:537 start_codon:yes stop_codon:yes gene_type:complete